MFAGESTAIGTLQNCQMRALSKIILRFDHYRWMHARFRGLTSTTWRCLKQLCPDLRVELNFMSAIQSRREVEFLIVPNMPISQLCCKFVNYTPQQPSIMEIEAFFNHLLACRTTDYLVSLCVKWTRPIPDLALPIIPFLLACGKLQYLLLLVFSPANGIDIY
ncbi:hypothetical protein AVEN_53837-1 [Araneus ventricosus]|uniref:F-box domain-containing protein n=1 Tax=Araneus ventricosus TaxID=182803 RepID=A0A4Y2EXJ2_ARAVE|nr:hypothetical protein AVEN_53837-1 [Araneus ventricosus]